MARVLISLLGGRPLPNITGVLHFKPDCLYLIASQDSMGPGGNYEKAVNALPNHLKPAQPLAVKPYALQEIVRLCQDIASKHRDDEIVINSASEPKTMAFGAYDVAKELKAHGAQIDLCYSSREGLVWVFRETDNVEPLKIGLEGYLASYGWNVCLPNDDPPAQFQQLAALLYDRLPASHRLQHVVRSSSGGKGKRTIRCAQRLSEDEYALLKEIEALGILGNVRRDDKGVTWTIQPEEERGFLLGGHWLEYSVCRVARMSTGARSKLLFDRCAWGIEDTAGKGEIDFAGIFDGQMLIASCKTEDDIKRAWFEELHSRAEQLGKGMCSTMLVSTVSRRTRDETSQREYEKWARERQIVLVMAEDLAKLSAIFNKIVLADSKAEPQTIPCYPRI